MGRIASFDHIVYDTDRRILRLLDQRLLPSQQIYVELNSPQQVWQAIRTLQVRGAPAIGIAAAWGLVLFIEYDCGDYAELPQRFAEASDYLATARPTAVNLFWALQRMQRRFRQEWQSGAEPERLRSALVAEAAAIQAEDAEMCRAIGEHALGLLKPGMTLLTHCNAGALATAAYGTALAPIYLGQERGYGFSVYADETRPLLQGARLTAWELQRAGIDVTLICDSMAAKVLSSRAVDAVLVGADRVAANGDTANKIGTLGLAILAKAYQVPFYVLCPSSTIDASIPDGDEIVIEEREPDEITCIAGQRLAPEGVGVYNPAFDVTPALFISAIITEAGVQRAPYRLA